MANDYRLRLRVALDDASFGEVEKRIKQLQDKGITDIKIRTNTDEMGQMQKAVIRWRDETGKVSAETFKVKNLTKDTNANLQKNVATTVSLGEKTNYWTQGIMQAAGQMLKTAATMGVIYKIVGQIGDGMQYIADLNKQMTNIQVLQVAGAQTDEEINSLASSYNALAQEMSATTLQVAEGSVEWLRQGKTIGETEELLRASLMMSKLGAVEAADATTYLTSTLNAYGMEAKDATMVVDKLVAVDNIAATSVAELAIAMQRSAVSGRQAGVTFDKLVSYIATVSSVTRRSAENIGESFKTMFARMQDIKAGKVDEEGIGLNDVESALDRINVKLRDDAENFRDMSDVLEDVAAKWQDLNEVEQANIAKAIAGVRQRENFLVLMNNMNMAFKYQAEESGAAGLALERYGIYEQSVEAASNRLTASWEKLWQDAMSGKALANLYDFGNGFLQLIDKMGGLETVVFALTAAVVLMNAEWIKGRLIALGGMLEVIPMVMAKITLLIANIAAGTGVTQSFNMVLGTTATTMGAIGIAVAALAAVYLVYKKQITETIQEGERLNQAAWDKSFKKIEESARNSSDVLKTYLTQVNNVEKAYQSGGIVAKLFVDKQEILDKGLKNALSSIRATSTSWEEYRINAEAAAKVSGYQIDEQGRLYRVIQTSHGAVTTYADGIELLSKNSYEAASATDGWRHAQEVATEAAAKAQAEYEGIAASLKAVSDQYDSMSKILKNYAEGSFGAEDVESLSKMFPGQYMELMKEENGLVELNTDKIKELAKERAQAAVVTARAAGEDEEYVRMLQLQVDLLDKAIPMSTQYVEQFSRMLESAGMQTENESFRGLATQINDLNVAFEQGTYTSSEYFNQLNNALENADFESAFEGNTESAQLFFSGLAENAVNALSQVSSAFDAGEISITEYADQLVNATGMFDMLGELTTNFGEAMGMSSDQIEASTANLGSMTEAAGELAQMQELNVLVQDAYVQSTQNTLAFGTEAYNNYMMKIAQAAVVSGQSFTDMNGNALNSAESIYSYLTASSGNFKNFANQTASKTGETIQKIVNSAGKMLQTLGSAISNFNAKIDFTPNIVGSTPFPLMEVFGQSVASINMPTLSYNISGSGGETLQALGQSISSFGAELATMDLNFDANIYTNPAGLDNASQAASNLADTLGTVSNAYKDLGKKSSDATKKANEDLRNMDDLLKLIINKIKQQKKAEKEALKDRLENYKNLIKLRKDLLKTMQEEKKYQEDLADKQQNLSAIQSEMLELQLDDSEEAKARLLQLQQDASEAQADIDDLQYQHGVDAQEAALDQEEQNFKDFIQGQIDEIDKYLSQPGRIASDAMDIINEKGKGLYQDLIQWNSVYGSGIDSDVTQAWNDAYSVLTKYKNALGELDYQNASGMLTGATAPSYHSGGFVGGLTSNETFGKLMKGEHVSTEKDMDKFVNTTLPEMVSNGSNGANIEKFMEITVQGNLDKDVMPQLEELSRKAINELNKALMQRGNIRGAEQFSI